MNNFPFSYERAEAIADDFEDLVDTQHPLSGGIIEYIAICPDDEDQFNAFVTKLQQEDRVDALELLKTYPTKEYDVVIITSTRIDDVITYTAERIRDYTQVLGIDYRYDLPL